MMKGKLFLGLLVLLFAPVIARAQARLVRETYVPNEIIIKFREGVANTIEKQLGLKKSAKDLELSTDLDELNTRHRLKAIKPLFKNFKKNRQRLNALLKKDKSVLTTKEKHVLKRLKRASKDAKVPELDRIYKVEVELEPGQSLEEVVAAYNNSPDVEYAELNYIVSIDLTPNDPLYPLQWALNNTGQMYPESGRYNHPPGTPDCDINAPEAWDIETGSWEVVVAVIDTGVDWKHRDLWGNMWVNEAELSGAVGVDDDNNGSIDDIYGYDFRNDDGDPMDDHGHGTHCAGIIAAKGNNARDITGVSWNAKIMAVKFLNKYGIGNSEDAVAALYYAVENGADVISNSWGSHYPLQAVEEAVNYAHSQGVVVVAAAGNAYSELPHYPAYYDGVLSVAATNSNDEKAVFSTYGDWVKIAAPGVDILSLMANGTSRGTVYDDYTTVMSGTSMACPHVSGASAMLFSIDPGISVGQLHNALTLAADPIAPGICASGRLNLRAALCELAGIVRLNRYVYSCSSLAEIKVLDTDLKGNGTQQVTVTTEGADEETVVLTESDSNSGIFVGGISTSSEAVVIQDGTLQVLHGQSITVTYHNTDDGTGNPAVLTDTAAVDCEPATIFNVEIDAAGPEPTVTFETDEPTKARVLFGLDCGEPNGIVVGDASLRTSHSIKLIGVSPETDYFFVIEVIDMAENVTLDDNAGNCYAFTTTAVGDIYIPGDYQTIQAAIDHCWDGGTVWVADGVYTGEGNRDIDFRGKIITVRSESGPENCIIDCNGSEAEPHRGFYFHRRETPNSVVDGFTITNGWVPDEGGGIKCIAAGWSRQFESLPTIRNCTIIGNTAADGGGIFYADYHHRPLISHCVLRGNMARGYGGGISTLEAGHYPFYPGVLLITNCMITRNTAGWGGGIYGVPAEITDCTISENSAHFEGGGIVVAGTVTNSAITDNFAVRDGGGIWGSRGGTFFINCLITSNRTGSRGGGCFAECGRQRFANCTISGNSAPECGGIWLGFRPPGKIPSELQIANCVLWNNLNEQIVLASIGMPNSITYSNIQGGWEGEGNIDTDPCFALETDCHLMPDSPCIDAGTNTFWADPPVTDMDGNPRILDGDGDTTTVVDMGAYEYNPNSPSIAVSVSAVGFSCVDGYSEPASETVLIRNCGGKTLHWEIVEDCNWLEATPASGESTGEVNEVTLMVDLKYLLPGYYSCILKVVDSNAVKSPVEIRVELNVGALLRVPERFPTIQAAIDAADDYDMVLVANGIYMGHGNRDIDFSGRAITVKSENGPANCIIDCNATEDEHHRGFSFTNWESRDSVLDGFTIINGYSPMGGGIYCFASNPTIANCIISCRAAVWGGGISCYESAPAIFSCIIHDSSALLGGGIACVSYGGLIGFDYETICAITDCSVIDNSAEKGGGVYWGRAIDAAITNCTIRGNTAHDGEGGGIYCEGGFWWSARVPPTCAVANCLISGNSAQNGGGIFCEGCEIGPWPRPCNAGGTLIVANSTITGNMVTDQVGGLSGDSNWDLTITNCVLWANNDANGTDEPAQLHGGVPAANYCCVQGWTGALGGTGNIDADPCFVQFGYWDANGTPGYVFDDFWVKGNYHLLPSSPCLDAGDNNSVPSDNNDLDGNPRIVDGDNDGNAVVDMGAYEYFVPPIEVAMKFTPQVLNPGSKGKWVKAHFVLPEEYAVEDVDVNAPAVVQPGGIESDHMNVFVNEADLVEIEAAFDRGEFCGIVTGGQPMEVSVTGSFISGQQFYGTDTIKITTNTFEYLAVLASHWLEEDCGKPDWCGGADLDEDSMVNFRDFGLFDGCCIEIITE